MLHIEVGSDKSLAKPASALSAEGTHVDYSDDKMIFTVNGKAAINLILASLQLNPDDEVYITSSFGARYVSKCVTCSVFNHCQPSKVITTGTRLIYIIHEFGVPHPETVALLKLATERNIPVLEDCAHSSNSYFDDGKKVGSKGDFVIYSLKKIFPMPVGGALKINKTNFLSEEKLKELQSKSLPAIEEEFRMYATAEDQFSQQRRAIFSALQSFVPYKSHFAINEKISPYVFSFEYPEPSKFVAKFNERHGELCECVTWYGYPIVSFPTHQLMDEKTILSIGDAIRQTIAELEQLSTDTSKP